MIVNGQRVRPIALPLMLLLATPAIVVFVVAAAAAFVGLVLLVPMFVVAWMCREAA